MKLGVGERIGVWEVRQALGRGGMGTVYRCSHVEAPRLEAAVKVLGEGLHRPSEAQVRFIREAEILGALDHPHIVRVRGLRMDVHPPFIEMDYVAGTPLDKVVKQGPVPVEQALTWMTQLASALAYLHGKGVKHRDVKPGNVLVTEDDRVVLVDFGLATDADLERITQEGLSFGTVSYAPPEWMDPDSLDAAQWDLYAVGVIFYELLTGQIAYPLSGKGPVRKQLLQVAMAKQKAPPLDPGPEVPEPVRAVIRKVTSKKIEDRYANAQELLEALRAAGRGEGASDALVVGARKWAPIVGGAVAVAALALGTVWFAGAGPATRPPPDPDADVALEPEVAPPEGGQVVVRSEAPATVQAGDVRADTVDGVARLDAVPGGAQVVRYAIGLGCGPCLDGGECSKACGVGELQADVPAGASVELELPAPPRVPVKVTLPQVVNARGGVFKKKDWPLTVRVGERRFTGEHGEASGTVAPGVHTLVVEVGECTPADRGCLPNGCPPKCSSTRRQVTVPWSGRLDLTLSDVPPPEK